MKTKRRWWIGSGIILVLLIGSLTWVNSSQPTIALSKEELENIIKKKYPGQILQSKIIGETYISELQRATGIYEIKANAVTGEVTAIKRMNETTEQAAPDIQDKHDMTSENEAKPNDVASSAEQPQQEQPAKSITAEEASAIALSQTAGYVDDIELVTINGSSFYLVEIEIDDDNDAEVQINAITGEIQSVTWDD